ncbi:MAG: MATE family efflux transporter [Bacteroidetes bacterium]|nr:MATE family efflux transporter [Bacteroidota bacterium]
MTTVFSLIISMVTVLFGKFLMRMFTDDQVVIEMGGDYLRIIGSFYILFSVMFVINGVLRGAGDTLIPMFISLFSLWIIRIPVAWVLANNPAIGVHGIWWSIPIGWLSGVILYSVYYRMGYWKKKAIVRRQAE